MQGSETQENDENNNNNGNNDNDDDFTDLNISSPSSQANTSLAPSQHQSRPNLRGSSSPPTDLLFGQLNRFISDFDPNGI